MDEINIAATKIDSQTPRNRASAAPELAVRLGSIEPRAAVTVLITSEAEQNEEEKKKRKENKKIRKEGD